MTEKLLGKIDFAEFGGMSDYPFMIGLQLGFSFNGSGVMDGGKYTVNITHSYKWANNDEKYQAYEKCLTMVYDTCKKAKVNYVSELKNKPVEVTMENGWFKDFRILEEVI
ncbi:MAG: hypothetical protein Q8910_00585 [Bacteroidota bacterium]|nr:hypothetical protein [Bacteroidota bacterium]